MSDLNFLLRRMNQIVNDSQSSHPENAATATLVGLVALIVLAGLL